MDSLPRMRQPSPPKYHPSDSEEEDVYDLDCKSCIKYKSKYITIKEQNKKLKQDLEQVESQLL